MALRMTGPLGRGALIACVVSVAAISVVASGARPQRQTSARSAAPSQGCFAHYADSLNLQGRVDGRAVHVNVADGHPAVAPNNVFGVALYPEEWMRATDGTGATNLDGRTSDDYCTLTLEESGPDGDRSAVWHLRFTSESSLEGTRTAGDQSAAVVLNVAPPTACDGRGTWRTFRDPGWPITFDYPASWRLRTIVSDETSVVLECPSAATMTFGGAAVTLELGSGREEVEAWDGRRGTRIDRFVDFGKDGWRVGPFEHSCLDEEVVAFSCEVPRKSVRRGVTMLQASVGEHRLYRPAGGYLGQGGGIDQYLLLIGDLWVTIDSANGDSVSDRLIRSITPR